MKKFRIHISENLDDTKKQLVNDYWAVEDERFVHKITDLVVKYELKQPDIRKLIKSHSYCERIFGNCIGCGIEIVERLDSKTALMYAYGSRDRCDKCKKDYQSHLLREERRLLEEAEKERTSRFDRAISEKRWLTLNEYEFSVLKELLKHRSLKAIKREVFKGDFYDKSIWNVVNGLERLGLVAIERHFGNSVGDFIFHPQLEHLITEHQENDLKKDLSFSLAKKVNKNNPRQADYAGTFTLPEDVLLTGGVKYIYGGWIQTDGSINLKFKPERDLDKPVIQTELEDEPKKAGDIIRDMFNEL